MTKFYADGRPAEEGGKPVRYDAGGRAHVVGGDGVVMPEPIRAAEKTLASEEMKELKAQLVFLRGTVRILQDVLGSVPKEFQGADIFHLLANFAGVALDLTEKPK